MIRERFETEMEEILFFWNNILSLKISSNQVDTFGTERYAKDSKLQSQNVSDYRKYSTECPIECVCLLHLRRGLYIKDSTWLSSFANEEMSRYCCRIMKNRDNYSFDLSVYYYGYQLKFLPIELLT